ncbi:GNAT family N-acetyltransferase [Bacillus bingmayongensis]|uniref:GNAT family N-acetyltransferase n=1 Tax=Bacillus bingmayongensis TaxID=1150157 RepID=UPI0002F3CC48|nr:GNAT family N-acetyltransferase [Bacillus bingmayongensis]
MLKGGQSSANEYISKLLKYAVGSQEVSLQKAIRFYEENRNTTLYQYKELGCIGMEFFAEKQARICHIAVLPDNRNKGVAFEMIKKVIYMHELTYIEAETDCEVVEFYKNCGFTITSLGEKYPGVERFHCYWVK